MKFKKRVRKLLATLLSIVLLMGTGPVAARADGDLPFSDVKSTDWFYDCVRYAFEKGLMTSYGEGTFQPSATTTRAMVVTILYRLEGAPQTDGVEFPDVANGQWYEEPIKWASAVGIVNGYGDGNFRPGNPITREQMATIMYHYASYKGYDVSDSADLSSYPDINKVSNYALEGMAWANATGIITGVGGARLEPRSGATRAQVAAILMRFCEQFNNQGSKIYTVHFETNGGSEISDQSIYEGDLAFTPATPTKMGYTFTDWYTDESLTEPYNFNNPVNGNITLYAGWTEARISIILDVDTSDDTEVSRLIYGRIESDLSINNIWCTVVSENRDEENQLFSEDGQSFTFPVTLENGENVITAYVETEDGSITSQTIVLNYDAGEIVDYSNTGEVYDPADPRVIVGTTEETSEAYVKNILNLFFIEETSKDEREAFIEGTLNGTVAGYLNTVDMMQAWLPPELIAVDGYDGSLKLAEMTSLELESYAAAVAAYYDIVEDTYIDYIQENISNVTTNDPWEGAMEEGDLFSPETFTYNAWWSDYVRFPSAWEYDNYYNSDFFSKIKLGVMDSGFNNNHEEFSGSISVISKEDTPGDHGTHVTGIIAAAANNQRGLSGGMFNNVKLIAYDGSSNNENFSTTEKYAGLNKLVEAGAKVLNFSIGSAGNTSKPRYKTQNEIAEEGETSSRYIGKLLKKGYDFIVVQSAGNAGIDSVNNGTFAAINYDNCANISGVDPYEIISRVFVVSAVGNDGMLAFFSCGGESGVNAIAAPGVDIFSCGLADNTYSYMSGTSMAAPIVTATCGLTWSVNKKLTGSEVVDIVKNSVQGTAASNSDANTEGGMGIVDAYAAVENAIATLPTHYGHVVDAVTGAPIENAEIRIYSISYTPIGAEEVYYTDWEGRFELPKLPLSSYIIKVRANGYSESFRIHLATVCYYLHNDGEASLGTLGLNPVFDDSIYRIILRWTSEPSDLDSHLTATTDSGADIHVAYYNLDEGYANLDLDDTSYEGPETVTITDITHLRNVMYAVHDYTNRYDYSSKVLSASGAYVEVYKGADLLAAFDVPKNQDGTEWDVFAIDAAGKIIPINEMKYCEDPRGVLAR